MEEDGDDDKDDDEDYELQVTLTDIIKFYQYQLNPCVWFHKAI